MEAREPVGPARNLIEFARAARQSPELPGGVEVCIATFLRGDPKSPTGFITAIRNAGLPSEVLLERRRFDPRVFDQLRRIVASCRPHILQTHNVKSHLLVRQLGLWRNYPWLAFRHGYTATNLTDRIYSQFDRWSLRRAYRVVSVCGAFSAAIARNGVKPDRIVVQHNAARPFERPDQATIELVRAQLPVSPGAALILCAGRLSKEKGHADLIDAITQVVKKRPDLLFHVVLAGDGPERENLIARARRMRVNDMLTFAGYQFDIRPYYALADAVVLPSHSEGSPNVILESMAAGVAVVATAVGGIPEIVVNGETGLLVPRRDPAAMADAVVRLLSDPPGRQRIAEAGRRYVIARHSPEEYRKALVQLYLDTVRSYSPDGRGGR